MAARMPSRCLRRVRASRTNGRSRERAAQASQASRCAGASAGSAQVVEQPQLFAQQEGAVEAAVGVLDLAERGELADGLVLGRLEQRPAGALDPAAGRGVGALVARSIRRGGPGRSRAAPRRHDVERVKADLGVRGRLSRIARWYSPLMSIETARIESLRSPSSSKKPCKVALLRPGAHHTIAPVRVVGDRGQVAVMAAIGDLVDADADQAGEAALVEVIGDHALDDPPDRVPADPQQPRDRRRTPSAAPATRRRPRSRACSARPGAPTGPAPAARRSRGSAAGAARTR